MMKLLVTLLLLLGCSRSSPLAEPDDYQYEDSQSDLELEETDIGDIDIQITSRPSVVEGKIGEKVLLPCKVQPEGTPPPLLMKYKMKSNINSCNSVRPGV